LNAGRFITLEGIEGSGKSLQLFLLEEELKGRALHYLVTREPGGTAFGLELRKLLLYRNGPPREPVAELLLYLADRWQHLKEIIEPALTAGQTVVCDRYHHATLAYQGHARGLGFSFIDQLAGYLALPLPDLAVVLDLDPEVALSRARSRNAGESEGIWGRFEAEALDFHGKVREGYRQLSERDPQRVVLVDASGTPQAVFARLQALLHERGMLEPPDCSVSRVKR
jgi:dTMP kinase